MAEQWLLINRQADYMAIAEKLGVTPLLVKLMLNRDVNEEDMPHYLNDDMASLADPLLMKGVAEATEILMRVADSGERIAVVSDYDCDGIFSGMILYTGLKRMGADPVIYTPDRVKDGYGINKRIIDDIYNQGINYIITCDNGIAAYDEISYAKGLGMCVIITDHHEIPFDIENEETIYKIPPADAVCNPKQHDCAYPYKGLCGAGVVYRLIDHMYNLKGIDFVERNILIQYAAIATVTDIMELTGENRIIVKTGLNYLSKETSPGLNAMKEVCNLQEKMISVYHIGFVIGPCFNAAGRLQTVKPAIELLQTDDEDIAKKYAEELHDINDERKKMTEEGAENALKIIKENEVESRYNNSGQEQKPEEHLSEQGGTADSDIPGVADNKGMDRVIVIILEDCHESIAGIIAGRIKEAIYRPTFVFTRVGDGLCKGSGRSIPAYNMYEELSACDELFERFGGHAMAAGITMKEEYIKELKTRLNNNCKLTKQDMTPVVRIDAEVLFRHITKDMIRSLHRLEPYGNGNPKPLFCARDVRVIRASVVGRIRQILKMVLTDKVGDRIEAVYFGEYEEFLSKIEEKYGTEQKDRMLRGADNDVTLALTFYPDINEYNGIESLQLVIQGYIVQGQATGK